MRSSTSKKATLPQSPPSPNSPRSPQPPQSLRSGHSSPLPPHSSPSPNSGQSPPNSGQSPQPPPFRQSPHSPHSRQPSQPPPFRRSPQSPPSPNLLRSPQSPPFPQSPPSPNLLPPQPPQFPQSPLSGRSVWHWRWLVSHAFVLCVVVAMIGLGFWQLQRLDQRRAQNQQVEALFATPPQPIDTLLQSSPLPPDHTTAVASGTYLDEHSFLVANRTFDTEPGSWLVTPLQLADGTVVVVSRGWVPRLWAAGVQTLDLSAPSSEVRVVGRVFRSVDGGRIGSNDVSILTELNRLDLARVEELIGLKVAPLWLQLERQQPVAERLPAAVPRIGLDDGPHFSYAVQWFFFSLGTIVVYALILRKRTRMPSPRTRRDSPEKRRSARNVNVCGTIRE